MLRRMSRGTVLIGVLAGSLIAGFVALTALGLGGTGPATRRTPLPAVHRTAYDPHPAPTGLVGRSESIGQRENGGAGVPDAPVLAEQVPFDPAAFRGPIAAYRRYAAGQVRVLIPAVARLEAAIDRGDRRTARAAWRSAFARFLRVGAAYGSLGPLDDAIEGLPGRWPGGIRDGRFTGFHRLEAGLWTATPVRSLRPAARRLRRDVARLRRAVRVSPITPVDYATRAHEILEDAQRDFLTGTAVAWSGEGVLATASGVEATAIVLGTLRPLLKGQQASITAPAGVARVRHTLAALRTAHGGTLPTLRGMSHRERLRLIGSVGGALERLQSVPGSLEVSDPAPVPPLETTP